jgi:hypothetical protein
MKIVLMTTLNLVLGASPVKALYVIVTLKHVIVSFIQDFRSIALLLLASCLGTATTTISTLLALTV